MWGVRRLSAAVTVIAAHKRDAMWHVAKHTHTHTNFDTNEEFIELFVLLFTLPVLAFLQEF